MLSEIKKICKKIKNDYDASFLDNVSPDIKNLFITIVDEFKDSGKGNISLINIIYNYFYGVLPSSKYISGPFTLSYQTSVEYNMNIYIFGEKHGNKNQCSDINTLDKSSYLNISEYLHLLFLNSSKFIDFYLEDELFRTVDSDRNKNFLWMLGNDFDKCLNPTKRSECIYKTVRTHFVNARYIQNGKFLSPTNSFEKLILHLEKGFPYYNTPFTKDLKKIFLYKSFRGIASFVIKTAINIPIIKKELDKCYLDKKLLINTFKKVIIKHYTKVINWNIFNINISNFYKSREFNNKNLIRSLILLQAPIMDFYAICRIFKIFKKSDNLPDKPKHIIYYAGDYHSNIFRSFLDELKFKKRYDIKNNIPDIRCLDINNTKLDFK